MTAEQKFAQIRKDFPILKREFRGRPLVYLDSAATSLKPDPVVQRIADYYRLETANVHRGAYALSDEATQNFEAGRRIVASFLGAKMEEIVFTRNTTEAINLVAFSWGEKYLRKGDRILVSEMEHHANIVPWQLLAERIGAVVEPVAITDEGFLDEEDFARKLREPVKLVAITGCSNTLGTYVELRHIITEAHRIGAKVLVDAAQMATQVAVDVKKLDADFVAVSGHKLFGPTGIGALYAKPEILADMPPWQGGGSMIVRVDFAGTTYNEPPYRFEAGTPHIEGAVGWGAGLAYFTKVGIEDAAGWKHGLLERATAGLREIDGVKLYADVPEKGAIISFNLEGVHPSDVGQILDQAGVAVRAGHHCCQPLMKRLGVPGTVRASFSIYNDFSDVEVLLGAVRKARELLL